MASDEDVGDADRAHGGLEVVGRDARTGDELALLARIGRLDAAVEEVGHVGILLGLGDVELVPAGLGEGLRQRSRRLGWEGDEGRQPGFVLGHRHHQQIGRRRVPGRRAAIEALERATVRQRMGELPRPVRPEVGVDDRLARAQPRFEPVDDGRRDELVGLATSVGGLDRRDGRRDVMRRLAVHDGVVAALDPVPAGVAIHRPVPPPDRRDGGVRMGGRQPALEIDDVAERRRGRGVASVEQRVDPDERHPLAPRELGQCHEVPVVGVDAARADEADDAQDAAGLARPGTGLQEGRTLEERAVGDGGVDPGQVLEHRPAGPEVEVADLRVAHLPGWQPNGLLRGSEAGVRPVAQEGSPGRHGGGGDGVGCRVAPDAEPVEDDQDDRAWPGRSGRHAAAPSALTRSCRGRCGPGRSARRGPRSRPSRRA